MILFSLVCATPNLRFPIELPVNLGSLISLMQVEKLHWALLLFCRKKGETLVEREREVRCIKSGKKTFLKLKWTTIEIKYRIILIF